MGKYIYGLAITGNILLGDRFFDNATFLIVDQKIAGIASKDISFEAREQIFAEEKWILPGVLDSHVHCTNRCGNAGSI